MGRCSRCRWFFPKAEAGRWQATCPASRFPGKCRRCAVLENAASPRPIPTRHLKKEAAKETPVPPANRKSQQTAEASHGGAATKQGGLSKPQRRDETQRTET